MLLSVQQYHKKLTLVQADTVMHVGELRAARGAGYAAGDCYHYAMCGEITFVHGADLERREIVVGLALVLWHEELSDYEFAKPLCHECIMELSFHDTIADQLMDQEKRQLHTKHKRS